MQMTPDTALAVGAKKSVVDTDDVSAQSRQSLRASSIFCDPHFLSIFQLSPYRPYADSKTIVDSTLLKPTAELSARLSEISSPSSLSREKYLELLQAHLAPPDSKGETSLLPPDFVLHATPKFALRFPKELLPFVEYLSTSFRYLYRESCRDGEGKKPNLSENKLEVLPGTSLIALPHGYFVPGGRFRECYYWDSYWTLQGLLACSMADSAMNAVRNLIYMVKAHGFVPNGNRTYYLDRSQPPMLTEMVRAVYEHLEKHDTNNAEEKSKSSRKWLEECLPALVIEYNWWMRERSVSVQVDGDTKGTLNRYTGGEKTEPRPESYKEDVEAGHDLEKWGHILAAAESGWDFSSRWVCLSKEPDGTNSPVICTRDIVPVCLNSILLRVESLLGEFQHVLGRPEEAMKYRRSAEKRKRVMMALMWDKDKHVWRDYNWRTNKVTSVISAAGWFPLWAKCYEGAEQAWEIAEARRCVNALMRESAMLGIAGLGTTPEKEGHKEQWDWPNGWPPVQELIVRGLLQVEDSFGSDSGGRQAAETVSKRWLGSLWRCWERDKVMHEKYDVRAVEGKRGEGGEYEPQIGFGWTNGVALELMSVFRKEIEKNIHWLYAPT